MGLVGWDGGMVGWWDGGFVGWKRIKSRLRRKKTAPDANNGASCVSRVACRGAAMPAMHHPLAGRMFQNPEITLQKTDIQHTTPHLIAKGRFFCNQKHCS